MNQYKLYNLLNNIANTNREIIFSNDFINNKCRLNFSQHVLFYNFISLLNLDFSYDHGEISTKFCYFKNHLK